MRKEEMLVSTNHKTNIGWLVELMMFVPVNRSPLGMMRWATLSLSLAGPSQLDWPCVRRWLSWLHREGNYTFHAWSSSAAAVERTCVLFTLCWFGAQQANNNHEYGFSEWWICFSRHTTNLKKKNKLLPDSTWLSAITSFTSCCQQDAMLQVF